MAITVLENNFAIAPLVLWSWQVCVCTGTLSRSSMLFQVISLLSRLDVSLQTPALDGSEQMLQFFLPSPFLSSLLSTTSWPATSVPTPRAGGFAVLPHASAARLWFRLSLLLSQCIEIAASLLLQIKHLPMPLDTPPHSELSWKSNFSSIVSYYKTKRLPSDDIHIWGYQSKVTHAPQALNYSLSHWPDYLFRQAVTL